MFIEAVGLALKCHKAQIQPADMTDENRQMIKEMLIEFAEDEKDEFDIKHCIIFDCETGSVRHTNGLFLVYAVGWMWYHSRDPSHSDGKTLVYHYGVEEATTVDDLVNNEVLMKAILTWAKKHGKLTFPDPENIDEEEDPQLMETHYLGQRQNLRWLCMYTRTIAASLMALR